MKIVILVDYSNKEFNKDFQVSNKLISDGHNVFLAINSQQFDDLRSKCDGAYLGYSVSDRGLKFPCIADFVNE